MSFYFFRIVEYIKLHLFARLQSTRPRMNIEYFIIENMFFKCFFRSWLSRIRPSFQFYLWVVWKFELPVCLDSSNIFNCQNNFPWFWSIFNWNLTKIPIKNSKISYKIIHCLIRLIWIIKNLFIIIQRIK